MDDATKPSSLGRVRPLRGSMSATVSMTDSLQGFLGGASSSSSKEAEICNPTSIAMESFFTMPTAQSSLLRCSSMLFRWCFGQSSEVMIGNRAVALDLAISLSLPFEGSSGMRVSPSR